LSDQFFESYPSGQIQTKAEMVASQSANAAAHPASAPGTGPNPQEFKLMAVYGNVALATDHTIFKAIDPNGKLAVTGEARVLRICKEKSMRARIGSIGRHGSPVVGAAKRQSVSRGVDGSQSLSCLKR
jgi:hypothetical protein